MEKDSQIIRLPKKYGELINTLNNEEAWKIIKEIFWYKQEIQWLSKVYFDMINVDLKNLEKAAINWIKWWRPNKEKPQVITPGYEKEKPLDIKKHNLKEREREREREYKIEEFLELYEDKEHLAYRLMKKCFDMGIKITHPLNESFKKNLTEKLKNIRDDKKKNVWEMWEELQKMVEHHAVKWNDFWNTLNRINTWFNPKFK